MKNTHLRIPEYVEKELKARKLDSSKCLAAIILDNETIIELFSDVIQSKDAAIMLEDGRKKGYFRFSINTDNFLLFGVATFEKNSILNIKITPFASTLQDDEATILDSVSNNDLWTVKFKYHIDKNGAFDIQINWDIILNFNLECIIDEFIKKQSNNLH